MKKRLSSRRISSWRSAQSSSWVFLQLLVNIFEYYALALVENFRLCLFVNESLAEYVRAAQEFRGSPCLSPAKRSRARLPRGACGPAGPGPLRRQRLCRQQKPCPSQPCLLCRPCSRPKQITAPSSTKNSWREPCRGTSASCLCFIRWRYSP